MHLAKIILPVALALIALPAVAFAQTTDTPKIDQRQTNQQQRIGQGLESGQVTAKEGVKLEKGQARVQTIETKAKADGTVTKAEKAKITHAQNVQSKKIAVQKHDAQTQGTQK
jgi:hypothetical protein